MIIILDTNDLPEASRLKPVESLSANDLHTFAVWRFVGSSDFVAIHHMGKLRVLKDRDGPAPRTIDGPVFMLAGLDVRL